MAKKVVRAKGGAIFFRLVVGDGRGVSHPPNLEKTQNLDHEDTHVIHKQK
jgi:hypothetical protein